MYFCKVNWKIIHIEETDSTNRWVREKFAPSKLGVSSEQTGSFLGANSDFVVWTDYQTAGRGCGTNRWESERGQNLLFSLLIHPVDVPASQQFRITEWASVALCETLERYLPCPVEIKWPNDIYVGDRKICGMLIENTLKGSTIKDSIIGIGLDVNQRMFHSDAPNPVSMWQLTGQEFDREELLHAFLQTFDAVLTRKTASNDYRNRLYRRSGKYAFKDANGLFMAEIACVHPDGRLELCDDNGQTRLYAFKEVQYVLG